MEHLQRRLEALEQQMHTVNCRLRWWRGLAGGLLGLAVLTWALPLSTAQEESLSRVRGGLVQRLAALEQKLQHITVAASEDGVPEVVITGANLRIVNGLGTTNTTNGLGNLIVGYNELRSADPDCPPTNPLCTDTRTGSHNIVVGNENNFSSFGGLLAGQRNEISGPFASVSGGIFT